MGSFREIKCKSTLNMYRKNASAFQSMDYNYQITAIDDFSRKRVLKIVDGKLIYETTKFLGDIEERIGFLIYTIQVDNVCECINDEDQTSRASHFERKVKKKGWKLRRLRPYSPSLLFPGKKDRCFLSPGQGTLPLVALRP